MFFQTYFYNAVVLPVPAQQSLIRNASHALPTRPARSVLVYIVRMIGRAVGRRRITQHDHNHSQVEQVCPAVKN